MTTELQLGPRIRALRQARRLTLRDVAARSGVTESFLSQVERDVASPSIATVGRIARALDLSIAQLFASEQGSGRVVRREARRRVAYPGLRSVDEFLTSNMAGRLQVIMSTIEPGGGTGEEAYTHDSDEEVVVVLAGRPRPVGRRRALRPARGRRHHLPVAPAALEHEPRRHADDRHLLPHPAELLRGRRREALARAVRCRCYGVRRRTGPSDARRRGPSTPSHRPSKRSDWAFAARRGPRSPGFDHAQRPSDHREAHRAWPPVPSPWSWPVPPWRSCRCRPSPTTRRAPRRRRPRRS